MKETQVSRKAHQGPSLIPVPPGSACCVPLRSQTPAAPQWKLHGYGRFPPHEQGECSTWHVKPQYKPYGHVTPMQTGEQRRPYSISKLTVCVLHICPCCYMWNQKSTCCRLKMLEGKLHLGATRLSSTLTFFPKVPCPPHSTASTARCYGHQYCQLFYTHRNYLDSQNWLYSLEGPRKNTINALEKQIQVYFREIFRLRSAQNSNVPIFDLPAELLSEVFLCIIESDLEANDTCFGAGTFGFRQVCRHWNEVAIGFPQLWTWWTSGNTKAWHLFKSWSKDAPLVLTWRYHYPSLQDIPKDPTLPVRIRQLNFSGGSKGLDSLLDALNSGPLSNLSSIQLELPDFRYEEETKDHFACFLPHSFPKLSKLDIEQCRPDSSSPLFTTSNLTSLKLFFHYHSNKPCFTLAQFSKILQRHPNLQELDLGDGTIPRVGSPEILVSITLPQLVDLRLCGMAQCISGFVNTIDMSSPLYNVILYFHHRPGDLQVPTLVNAVKEILAAVRERVDWGDYQSDLEGLLNL